MKDRPILFTGEMVRAILDGRKTQTRRPVTNQKHPYGTWATPEEVVAEFLGGTCAFSAPLGTVGDRLWVRETWGLMAHHDTTDWFCCSIRGLDEDSLAPLYATEHRANWRCENENAFWRSPVSMPRWASRIDLEITAVRVERVQDITEEDAGKEGVCLSEYYTLSRHPHRSVFHDLWQSIYGTWDSNPWVWVYEFRRVKP